MKGQCIYCNISWEGTIHHVLSVTPTACPFKVLSWEAQRPYYHRSPCSLSIIYFSFSPGSNALLFSASVHLPDLLSLEALYLSHWPYTFLNTQRLMVCLLWRCPQLSMFFLYKLHFHASLFIFMLLLIILFSLFHILLATRDTCIVLQYYLQ